MAPVKSEFKSIFGKIVDVPVMFLVNCSVPAEGQAVL